MHQRVEKQLLSIVDLTRLTEMKASLVLTRRAVLVSKSISKLVRHTVGEDNVIKKRAFLLRESPDHSIPLTGRLLKRMKWDAHAHLGRIHGIPASVNPIRC